MPRSPSPTPGVYPNSRASSQWCYSANSSSVIPFSSCLQSLPESGCFPMSQLFSWGGQSIGVSASASVLPMNTQDWSPLGWTCWISLQSKGLSRVFFNTTVQKHQFFDAQLSSQYNSHIHTRPLEKPLPFHYVLTWQKRRQRRSKLSAMSLLRTLTPSWTAPLSWSHINLITSQKSNLQIPSHWELGLQYMIFWGTHFCPNILSLAP